MFQGFRWLTMDMKPGDSLVFHFSGEQACCTGCFRNNVFCGAPPTRSSSTSAVWNSHWHRTYAQKHANAAYIIPLCKFNPAAGFHQCSSGEAAGFPAASRPWICRARRAWPHGIRPYQPNPIFCHPLTGHGSQCRDYSGEETDGMNETLCPMDFRTVSPHRR